jgi:hypothetical protein
MPKNRQGHIIKQIYVLVNFQWNQSGEISLHSVAVNWKLKNLIKSVCHLFDNNSYVSVLCMYFPVCLYNQ